MFRKVWTQSVANLKSFWPMGNPIWANGQTTMTVHNYRHRQFHRTSNGENPSSGYRDMGSANLAAARPPARTVTIPLKQGGLRGKKHVSERGSCPLTHQYIYPHRQWQHHEDLPVPVTGLWGNNKQNCTYNRELIQRSNWSKKKLPVLQ